MEKIHKHIIAIAVVLVVTGVVFVQYFSDVLGLGDPRSAQPMGKVEPAKVKEPAGPRQVSAEVRYEVPGDKFDDLRFVVTVDAMGSIENIDTLDAATGKIPEKKVEFNSQVNVILKGKKLAELTKIDKVGKSTLTTDAFNTALPDLQKQL